MGKHKNKAGKDSKQRIKDQREKGEKQEADNFKKAKTMADALKQDDMVSVKQYEDADFIKREFVAITSEDKSLYWNEANTAAFKWKFAKEIEPEATYYYQWELLKDGEIFITNHMTDKVAASRNLDSEYSRYKRIDSSKRTWDA